MQAWTDVLIQMDDPPDSVGWKDPPDTRRPRQTIPQLVRCFFMEVMMTTPESVLTNSTFDAAVNNNQFAVNDAGGTRIDSPGAAAIPLHSDPSLALPPSL